jgi:hypothetical protein
MKIVKEQNKFGLDIIIKEEDKYLSVSMAGNGDLYWIINVKNDDGCTHQFFNITKENYELYKLFEGLFFDLDTLNITFPYDVDPFCLYDDYVNKEERLIEKKRYRLYNKSHYKDLYDEDRQIISWHSDETAYDVSNILKIKKVDDAFVLEFIIQTESDEYDKDFGDPSCIPVRFRNSGSRYKPFNVLFNKMYHGLESVEDTHEIGHQIHMEEYLYNKDKKLSRRIV